MEENTYLQSFEEGRIVTENYFEYLVWRNDVQHEQSEGMSRSLDSVVEEVRAAGVVSAMAAQEAMQSHNKTFTILAAMSRAQDYLAQLIADIKKNGGVGGNGIEGIANVLGSSVGGAATAGGLTALIAPMLPIALSNPVLLIPAIIASAVAGRAAYVKNKKAKAAKEASQLFIDNALSANSSSREIAEGIAIEQNNPRSSQEAPPTFKGAIAIQATTTPAAVPPKPAIPNPSTGADESTQIYNMQTHVTAMPPQSAQVVVQAVPAAAPEQTITIHMNNEIKGALYDARAFKDLSDYLVDRLKEQFDRRGVRYSNNW